MQYLKKNIKYSIFAFFIIILSITISISTLAKTEVYFSLYDNPQKEIIKNINQAESFINIAMYIFTDRDIALPLVKACERGVNVILYRKVSVFTPSSCTFSSILILDSFFNHFTIWY